jgi:prepilin-type N-terminal cleavage/methylation domain-containing protein
MIRRGFSLIEVLISMAILSIGIVGAIRVFPVGLRASQRAELAARATQAGERTRESSTRKTREHFTPGQTTRQQTHR